MAALISSVMSTKDRVPFYVAACDEMGIEVLPPDVNVSVEDFRVVEGKIRFGLNAVKNVGESAVRAILAAREEGGPFAVDLGLLRARRPAGQVNKRALESLVKCGALDSTGATRRGMLEVLEHALVSGGRLHRRPPRGPGLDLRPRRRGAEQQRPRASTTGRSRPRSSRSASCSRSRRRASASTSPSTRSTRCATSCGARPTAAWPRSSAAATARWSPSAASSARSSS